MSNSIMDCAGAEPLLDEYGSGELTGQAREAVDDHLRRCADCRYSLHELRALDSRIRALPNASAPEDLLAQVLAKLPSQRLGMDPIDTAPSARLSEHAATCDDTDEKFLRFARVAA